MAMDLSDIPTTFAASLAADRQTSRDEAIKRGLAGFAALTEGLQQKRGAAKPLAQTTIDAVLRHDTAPTKDLRSEAKRTILRWAKKSDLLSGLLTTRRRARVRRGTV